MDVQIIVPGGGGGGGSVTADNGLTVSGAVKLGGTLLQNTVIDATSDYNLLVMGQGGTLPFTVNSESNIAAQFNSQFSIAVQGNAGDFYPAGHFTNSTPYVDSVIDTMHIQHVASGTPPLLGIGVGLSMNISDDSGVYQATRLVSKWTDLTHATRSSEFSILGVDSGNASTLFTLNGDGSTKLNKYGVGSFMGTGAYTLQVDASGNIIEAPFFKGGQSFFTADGIIDTFDIVHNLGSIPSFFTLTTTEPISSEHLSRTITFPDANTMRLTFGFAPLAGANANYVWVVFK